MPTEEDVSSVLYRIDQANRNLEVGLILDDGGALKEEGWAPCVSEGEVFVAWYPSGEKSIARPEEVTPKERKFRCGDVVLSSDARQLGKCQSITTIATLHCVDSDRVIAGVPTAHLAKFRASPSYWSNFPSELMHLVSIFPKKVYSAPFPSVGDTVLHIVNVGDTLLPIVKWKGKQIYKYGYKLREPKAFEEEVFKGKEKSCLPSQELKSSNSESNESEIPRCNAWAQSLYGSKSSTVCIINVKVTQITSLVEVVWQDASSSWLMSNRLEDAFNYFKPRLFPGDYLFSIYGKESDAINGWVEKYNGDDEVVTLRWLKGRTTASEGRSDLEEVKREDVALYDLIEDLNLSFNSLTSTSQFCDKGEVKSGLSNCDRFLNPLSREQIETLCESKERMIPSLQKMNLVKAGSLEKIKGGQLYKRLSQIHSYFQETIGALFERIFGRFCSSQRNLSQNTRAAMMALRKWMDNEVKSLNERSLLTGKELVAEKRFLVLEQVPVSHTFHIFTVIPSYPEEFFEKIRSQLQALQCALPDGIYLKTFSDKIYLLSVLIVGPEGTPFEDGLFTFDLLLPGVYPYYQPFVQSLNFDFKLHEPWMLARRQILPEGQNSLLKAHPLPSEERDDCDDFSGQPAYFDLQHFLLSLQASFVAESCFGLPDDPALLATPKEKENNAFFNRLSLLKVVETMTSFAKSPPDLFARDVREHLLANGPRFLARLESWTQDTLVQGDEPPTSSTPHFISPPFSKGFCSSLRDKLNDFKEAFEQLKQTVVI